MPTWILFTHLAPIAAAAVERWKGTTRPTHLLLHSAARLNECVFNTGQSHHSHCCLPSSSSSSSSVQAVCFAEPTRALAEMAADGRSSSKWLLLPVRSGTWTQDTTTVQTVSQPGMCSRILSFTSKCSSNNSSSIGYLVLFIFSSIRSCESSLIELD